MGGVKQVAIFHLHPNIMEVTIQQSKVLIGEMKIVLNFKGEGIIIEKESYKFAEGFNKEIEGVKLKVF